jgi:hypothetical protein
MSHAGARVKEVRVQVAELEAIKAGQMRHVFVAAARDIEPGDRLVILDEAARMQLADATYVDGNFAMVPGGLVQVVSISLVRQG